VTAPAGTDVGLAFVTGLTTGGLSCLAVQAGLLATSVARQAETDVVAELAANHLINRKRKRSGRKLTRSQRRREREALSVLEAPVRPKRRRALPLLLFLGAKLAAYTVLGLLLGWLGSVIQLSPYSRAALQVGIGIFMLGTAGRLFDLHPVFRYFVIEPPRFLTRFIRRFARNSDGAVVTPVFLGALTIFIPCGVTQAMMVLAVGAGNPLAGAAVMFAFILGTTPVFFGLAYVATRLGEALQSRFLQFAGAVIVILALVSIEGGLNLMGSPYSFSNVAAAAVSALSSVSATGDTVPAVRPEPDGSVTVSVFNTAYSPYSIQAPARTSITLHLVTSGTTGCTRSFVIPALGIQRVLPETGTLDLVIPASGAAGDLRFTCSMGMYSGHIQFN